MRPGALRGPRNQGDGLGRYVGGFGIERIDRAVARDEEFRWRCHIAMRLCATAGNIWVLGLEHEELDPPVRYSATDGKDLLGRDFSLIHFAAPLTYHITDRMH